MAYSSFQNYSSYDIISKCHSKPTVAKDDEESFSIIIHKWWNCLLKREPFSKRCYIFIYDDFLFSAQPSTHNQPTNVLLRHQYDIEKGLLLKLDSFNSIQLGTIFRGLSRVPDEEVLNLYRNRIIPIAYVEGEKGNVRIYITNLLLLHVIALTLVYLLGPF